MRSATYGLGCGNPIQNQRMRMFRAVGAGAIEQPGMIAQLAGRQFRSAQGFAEVGLGVSGLAKEIAQTMRTLSRQQP